MIWLLLLLGSAFAVLIAVGAIRKERSKAEKAEREVRRLRKP